MRKSKKTKLYFFTFTSFIEKFISFRKHIWKNLVNTTLLKKKLWHRCFPVNFAKFLRTALDNCFCMKCSAGLKWVKVTITTSAVYYR